MNNISCIFPSDDIFIIHIIGPNMPHNGLLDSNLANTIKICIKFNSSKLDDLVLKENTPIFKKYKGIVIFKNTEDFNDIQYITVDVFKNKPIEKMMTELTINSESENNTFLALLTEHIKNVIFEHSIDYYNAIHIGANNTYNYTKNYDTKIDLDILINSLIKIQHIEESDYIYFHLNIQDI